MLERGALTLFVDLWSDRSRSPTPLLYDMVRRSASELKRPGSGLLQQLRRVKGVDFGAAGIALGVQLEGLGTPNGATLADDAGELAVLVFSRIAGGQSRGQFGVDTLAACSEALGREVSANDMIPAIDKRVAANLVVRKGVGNFEVADPFVKELWLRHAQMRRLLADPPRGPE